MAYKRIYDYPPEQREEVRAKRAEQERRYRARREGVFLVEIQTLALGESP